MRTAARTCAGKGMANAFSQVMGEVFTREIKPLEVEIIVAEVGDDRYADHRSNSLYRIKYDGFISDHKGFCVIGGKVEEVEVGPEERLSARTCPRGMRRGSDVAR